MNNGTPYPLGLNRLDWAARRELVMTMREAHGIIEFAAMLIGTTRREVERRLKFWQVESSEFGGVVLYKPETTTKTADVMLREIIREEIIAALKATHGNKVEACRRLGIPRQTLYNRMKKLEISLEA